MKSLTLLLLLLPIFSSMPSDIQPCLLLSSNLQTFLTTLGLPTTYTYKDGGMIASGVNGIIQKTTGVDGLIKVCNARQTFYNGMGNSYEKCINRYAIYDLGDTTINNARTLEHIFRQLQFECAGGFNIWADNRNCIIGADKITQCVNQYNGTIYGVGTSNFCTQNFQDFLTCVYNDYKNVCNGNVMTGWFGCERERVGWASDCTTLSCHPTNN